MTLPELSAAATQGEWRVAAYWTGAGTPDEKTFGMVVADNDWSTGVVDEQPCDGLSDSLSRDLDFIVALVNAYRTGQLVERAGVAGRWPVGTRVTKIKGSKWTGKVVGYYSTELTPEGYAVESETETGSVQIYPRAALTALKGGGDADG